jgi:hypothetical protein
MSRLLADNLLSVSLGDEDVVRNRTMDDVGELRVRNPNEEFGVRQLRDTTGQGTQSVDSLLISDLAVGDVEVRLEFREQLHGFVPERLRVGRVHRFGPLQLVSDRFDSVDLSLDVVVLHDGGISIRFGQPSQYPEQQAECDEEQHT